MSKKRDDYTTVSIPKAYAERVENFIRSHPEYGYVGLAEFFKEAGRLHIDRMERRTKDE